jgi:hypothetical protein
MGGAATSLQETMHETAWCKKIQMHGSLDKALWQEKDALWTLAHHEKKETNQLHEAEG